MAGATAVGGVWAMGRVLSGSQRKHIKVMEGRGLEDLAAAFLLPFPQGLAASRFPILFCSQSSVRTLNHPSSSFLPTFGGAIRPWMGLWPFMGPTCSWAGTRHHVSGSGVGWCKPQGPSKGPASGSEPLREMLAPLGAHKEGPLGLLPSPTWPAGL